MGKEKEKELTIFGDYQITHHAYVDVFGLLKSIPKWFSAQRYFFYEKSVSERDIGTGREVKSEWTAKREVNEYVQFDIEILVLIRDLQKVVLDGEETYWGRTTITIKSKVVKNHRNTFGPSKIQELLRQLYERYIIRNELLGYEGKLVGESIDLATLLRSYLR